MATRALRHPVHRASREGGGASHRARQRLRPLLRKPAFWVAAIFVLLVIAIRIALNPVAAAFTQKGLDSFEGYTGSFDSVRVGLLPPSYKITDLKLIQNGTNREEPLVYAKTIKARLVGRKLFKAQLVGVATVDDAKFFIKPGVTQPPKPKEGKGKAKDKDKADDKKKVEDPFNTQSALQKIIPFRLDRIELRNSEMVLIDKLEPRQPRLWVSDIQLVIENLVTREKLDEQLPQSLTMRAVVERTGVLKVMASADVIEDQRPALTGQAQLTGLKLENLHDWVAAKTGVGAKGTLDSFVNFSSAEGKVSGAVKVMVKNATLEPASEKASDAIKAAIGRMAIKVLSDRVEGRDAVVTTLPVKGTLDTPNAQIWPAVLTVVRNAFVQGADWGFSDLPVETAPEKQGILKQTAEGLDKKEEAPKAQPK